MRFALLAVLLAGCSDEVTIPNGCGNYVLDTGEYCDRPGSVCTSTCRITCVAMPPCNTLMSSVADCPAPRAPSQTIECAPGADLDGMCCPSGLACGVDGTCHAPKGLFAKGLVQPFDAGSVLVADVDGDYVADAVGTAKNAVSVRYGAAPSPLANLVSVPAPSAANVTSPFSFGDFDGDDRADVIIPTSSGLFALATDTGAPAAVQFPVNGTAGPADPGVTAGITHERVAPVYFGTYPLLVELDRVENPVAGDGLFQLKVIATPTPPDAMLPQVDYVITDTTATLCGLTLPTATESSVVRGRALHPFLDKDTIRVPIPIGSGTICVATANSHPKAPLVTGLYYVVPKSVLGTYKLSSGDGETFFANLESAPGTCPDLVVPVYDNSTTPQPFTMIIAGTGTFGANACTVDTSNVMFIAGQPLAAIDLAMSPARPGLVTGRAIYAYDSSTRLWSPVTLATRPWRFAVVADLDRDGVDDFATVSTSNDVEVFYQRAGTPTFPAWSSTLIQTEDVVRTIALGDFDGNQSGDVAIATLDSTSNLPILPAVLSIAWGSVDGTFDLESYDTFAEPYDLTAVNIYDTSLPLGLDSCDDLVIARGGADPTKPTDPALLIADYGSTARTLAAPFGFASTFGTTARSRGQGTAVVAGRFGNGATAGALAIFSPTAGSTQFSLLALTYNSATGAFDSSPETPTMSCDISPLGIVAPFCFTAAEYIPFRRDGGDLMLAFRNDGAPAATAECAVSVSSTLAGPALSTLRCDELAPAAAVSTDPDTAAAYKALTTSDRVQLMDNNGTLAHLLLSSSWNKHTNVAFLWEVTFTSSGLPQLANPVSINSELAAANVLPAGTTAACAGGTELELGTIAGTSYGAGSKEVVVACSVGPSATGGFSTQLFGRYADPGGGPATYAMVVDFKHDSDVSIRSGDIDGDGLTDLLLLSGTVGTASRGLTAFLQCDANDSSCGGTK
jgi:hypothetical protein